MSGKRNVSVCRGHDFANALYKQKSKPPKNWTAASPTQIEGKTAQLPAKIKDWFR